MTPKHSKEFTDYLADLVSRNPLLQSGDVDMDPWLRRTRYVWVTELAETLFEQGFLIDQVWAKDHCTNEDKRPETASCAWYGYCFDEDNQDFAFKAVWHLDTEMFLNNRVHQHYYVLTDLDLEPRVEYDRRQQEWINTWKTGDRLRKRA